MNSYTFELIAMVGGGRIGLRGDGLDGDTIQVPKGSEVYVVIPDTEKHHIYGAQIYPKGDPYKEWEREGSLCRQRFRFLTEGVNNVIFAVSKDDTSEVAYGPIIKIKPKSG